MILSKSITYKNNISNPTEPKLRMQKCYNDVLIINFITCFKILDDQSFRKTNLKLLIN